MDDLLVCVCVCVCIFVVSTFVYLWAVLLFVGTSAGMRQNGVVT